MSVRDELNRRAEDREGRPTDATRSTRVRYLPRACAAGALTEAGVLRLWSTFDAREDQAQCVGRIRYLAVQRVEAWARGFMVRTQAPRPSELTRRSDLRTS